MVGINSNKITNINTNGGTKKAGGVNSWAWSKIPYKIFSRSTSIITTTIQNIIDYLLGLLTTLFGDSTNAALADQGINLLVTFVKDLADDTITTVSTDAALLAAGFAETDLKITVPAGYTAAIFVTNLDARITAAELATDLEERVCIVLWYLRSNFLNICKDIVSVPVSMNATLDTLTTSMVTDLDAAWNTFFTGAWSDDLKTAIAAKNATNVIALTPLNGLTNANEKAIVIQLMQDILDA